MLGWVKSPTNGVYERKKLQKFLSIIWNFVQNEFGHVGFMFSEKNNLYIFNSVRKTWLGGGGIRRFSERSNYGVLVKGCGIERIAQHSPDGSRQNPVFI